MLVPLTSTIDLCGAHPNNSINAFKVGFSGVILLHKNAFLQKPYDIGSIPTIRP